MTNHPSSLRSCRRSPSTRFRTKSWFPTLPCLSAFLYALLVQIPLRPPLRPPLNDPFNYALNYPFNYALFLRAPTFNYAGPSIQLQLRPYSQGPNISLCLSLLLRDPTPCFSGLQRGFCYSGWYPPLLCPPTAPPPASSVPLYRGPLRPLHRGLLNCARCILYPTCNLWSDGPHPHLYACLSWARRACHRAHDDGPNGIAMGGQELAILVPLDHDGLGLRV